METVESSADPEFAALKKRLETLPLPEEAAKNTKRELGRLKRMPANMPKHQIIRKYLEWMSEMPWDIMSNGDSGGFSILNTLPKPPGVGKTSLGKSVANALGRKFYRISRGGVHDEAEIRGPQKTMLIFLGEIDKLTRDALGDSSAALLEVLEAEQNNTFTDYYLSVPFDLPQSIADGPNGNDSNSRIHVCRKISIAQTSSAQTNLDTWIGRRRSEHSTIHVDAHGHRTQHTRLRAACARSTATRPPSAAISPSNTHVRAMERHALDSFNGTVSPIKLEEILGQPHFVTEVSERRLSLGVVKELDYEVLTKWS
ncbi:hypothetical protein CcCBS67573_g09317 [Chytriomyces confervae]|uniref:ATPase AAA-type core domain-containing protein n=1 Tax=Chytriomyces confervae TaxID=246404 RepID=A0A507E0M6_9FUNG|nr:hypothetical protein CcCBS67573_g09317 [Chytriomyces confervae]